MLEIEIFTRAYNPFVMGGDPHQAIRTKWEVGAGKIDLGKGFFAYLTVSPGGKLIVIESETGAILGNELDSVIKDISDCEDVELMKKQVTDGLKMKESAKVLTPERFWKIYDA